MSKELLNDMPIFPWALVARGVGNSQRLHKDQAVAESIQSVHLHDLVLAHARKDFVAFRHSMTVGEVLAAIRQQGATDAIIYYYVVDEKERLIGVLPIRRLLSAEPGVQLREIMIGRVIAIPQNSSVLDACEAFVLHKLLAFPIIDDHRRILGVVDVGLFTEEIFDLTEREKSEQLFETLGFRISQVKDATPVRAFRFRFPWLLTTVGSGILCALLTSAFEVTLAQGLILVFFLALILGLGESVSIQSMSLAVQSLQALRPTLRWYLAALKRELTAALMLGAGCGVLVVMIIWIWRGMSVEAVVIALGIMFSLISACVYGLSVPALLHAFKLDPKVAAGPITLACTDLSTLFLYFSLAGFLL